MIRLALITAILLCTSTDTYGQQPLIMSGMVCDSAQYAQKIIDLKNQHVPDEEVRRLINGDRKEPVCGVVTVAFYPLQIVKRELMNGATVDIVHVTIIGAQNPDNTTVWLKPGIERYMILFRKTTPI